MPKVTEALTKLFETTCKKGCNNPDILQRYTPEMEVQINVAADHGELVEDRHNTWADEFDMWWHIRIPKGAMTEEAYWHDYTLDWSLAKHAEAIGMTGWDWSNKVSRWVGFDFDAITDHAKGIGMTRDELQAVNDAAQAIPWVETRLSTRGGGYHLYVYFEEGIPTKTHTEHAALARCVLTLMSTRAGFNFASAIDCCGGNMWVWHRDANSQNHGLSVIQPSTSTLTVADLPDNWRDNLEVITRKRTKVRVRGVSDDEQEKFETLANSRPPVILTEAHNQLLDDLQRSGFSTIWNSDYNLVQTHTVALKKVMEENPGKYEGPFETLSEGKDPGKPNAFLFPLPNKGWKVFRFNQGTREHESWEAGENGWTYTFFDRKPNFDLACRMAKGSEMDSGGYVFLQLSDALQATNYLGVTTTDINLERYGHRKAELRFGKRDGRLIIRMKTEDGETNPGIGWVEKRGGWWEKVLRGFRETVDDDLVGLDYWDTLIRNVKTPSQEEAGWFIFDSQEEWVRHPLSNIQRFLKGKPYSLSNLEVDDVMGQAIGNSWKLVNLPFQDEYPGKRQWNFQAAQWKYQPVNLEYDEAPKHPHWDLVLDHVGSCLDSSLKKHPWAQKHGIKTGRQYLQLWIASLLREPFDKLPYLFLYGPENCGKSTLHVAISKLMTKGVMQANRALTNANDFNGELSNVVLAVIEEDNIRQQAGSVARNRMKNWTTSDTISIRRMRMDVYEQQNTLHFIQCSNFRDACLAGWRDTRITMLTVPDFLLKPEIPKAILLNKLEEEAPHFMRTIVDLEIPPAEGRFRIPYISTSAKHRYEELQRDSLDAFIQDRCKLVNGQIIPLQEFYKIFVTTLPENEVTDWNTQKLSRRLPDEFPTGAMGHHNVIHIGNIVVDSDKEYPESPPYVRCKGRLYFEGQTP